jgi:ribose-phosphate pyrophosphokinase
MFDDLISTAGTICEAASLVMDNGAVDVICAATHGVFVGMALERIHESPISKVVVTDTISCTDRCQLIDDKLVELSVGKLLGEAIHRIHHDQSISAMFRTIVGTKR